MRTASATIRAVTAKTTTGVQVAALPYRVSEAGVEIMLITSRRTHRWIVPKGWPESAAPADDAAREALEEAGISGEVDARPIGSFRYIKERKRGDDQHCRVDLFPLKVLRQRRTWRERTARETRWFPYTEAATLVGEPQLRRLILRFGAQTAVAHGQAA